MRRLFALALTAAALGGLSAPATAAETCVRITGTMRVCVNATGCAGTCYVDPQCDQIRPPQLGCEQFDALYVPLPGR